MDLDALREPVSTLTHAAGCLLALIGTWWLWERGRVGGRTRQAVVLLYGLSLAGCLGASATYHGLNLSSGWVAHLRRIDHIGIHLLIAGTYTPIAWTLLRGPMRTLTLGVAWGIAALGSAVLLFWGVLPASLFTLVYLGAGWGAFFAYFEISRLHGYRVTRPILLGGVAYSVGAVLNVAGWPVLREGVVAAHEVFHLFVLAGAGWHFRFIATVVAPYREASPSAEPRGRVDAPQAGRPPATIGARDGSRTINAPGGR